MVPFPKDQFCHLWALNVDDSGGEIKVDYKLEIDDNKSGENDFHMFIREVGQLDDECSGDYKKTN